jgi:hypothetical protein
MCLPWNKGYAYLAKEYPCPFNARAGVTIANKIKVTPLREMHMTGSL